jgi:hypothetical protein
MYKDIIFHDDTMANIAYLNEESPFVLSISHPFVEYII